MGEIEDRDELEEREDELDEPEELEAQEENEEEAAKMECPFCGARAEFFEFSCPDLIAQFHDIEEEGWLRDGFEILYEIRRKMIDLVSLEPSPLYEDCPPELEKWAAVAEYCVATILEELQHPLIGGTRVFWEGMMISGYSALFFVEQSKQPELLAEFRAVSRKLDELQKRYDAEADSDLDDDEWGGIAPDDPLRRKEIRWTRRDFVRPKISPDGRVGVELWDVPARSWRDPYSPDEASLWDWMMGALPEPFRLGIEGLSADGLPAPIVDPSGRVGPDGLPVGARSEAEAKLETERKERTDRSSK